MKRKMKRKKNFKINTVKKKRRKRNIKLNKEKVLNLIREKVRHLKDTSLKMRILQFITLNKSLKKTILTLNWVILA